MTKENKPKQPFGESPDLDNIGLVEFKDRAKRFGKRAAQSLTPEGQNLNKLSSEIGRLMQEARFSAGFTDRESLAIASGIPKDTLFKLEEGLLKPTEAKEIFDRLEPFFKKT